MNEEETFRTNLSQSVIACNRVAAYLRSLGCETIVKPVYCRPTYEDRAAYGDGGGDVLVRKDGEDFKQLEVKWRRSLHFTSADDFKRFKPPDILVDRANKTTPPAYGYAIVNSALTHAAMIRGSTIADWSVRDTKEKRYSKPYPAYYCPVKHAKFVELPPDPPPDAPEPKRIVPDIGDQLCMGCGMYGTFSDNNGKHWYCRKCRDKKMGMSDEQRFSTTL